MTWWKYFVQYKKRKTIKLSIKNDLNVEIVAPLRTSKRYIREIIESKKHWIEIHRERMKRNINVPSLRKYEDGEKFYIMGNPYNLRVVQSDHDRIMVFQGDIFMYTKKKEDVAYKKRHMEKWYKEMAYGKLKNIYDKVCSKFDVIYSEKPELYFRKMKARWGSYSPIDNKILLNSQLVKVPEQCIEYVIVHELCHVRHRNHKKEFYDFLESFCQTGSLEDKNLIGIQVFK
ncbi:SprT family zinc-dependent metalloprotease [Clostridium sp. DMHC 10]|uniref:M48 family metallopeptidase n=1 Tax=Clostridium sp. DMHC 10 TaxID=747377 RepID=UPI00069E5DA7|nr:SprT family zinc-dependent metalloprotease [Clostridium sp. DMHC 10]